MPAGRPTKYKPEYCDLVIEHMAKGLSKESFAGVVGVDKVTVYNWIDAQEAFFNAVKRGEELSRLFWEELGRKGAMGSDEFNATAWIFNIKNRFRDDWVDRREHTGAGGGPIKTDSKVLQVTGVKPGADSDS